MATTREEVQIRLGMDSKGLLAGMASVKQKIMGWAKSVGGQLAGLFAFGAVLNQIKKTVDYVEQLTQRAAALSISNSFLQDLENVGIAAGKSQEQIQKMMTAFVKTLDSGQNPEQEFYKFLDALNATKDPAERLRMAFDKLSKSGIILLDFAKDGSKSFKEIADTFSKLSNAELRSVLLIDKQLDMMANKIKNITAKILFILVKMWEANTRADLADLNGKDRIKILAQEDVILSRADKLAKDKLHKETKILDAKTLALQKDKDSLSVLQAIGNQMDANNAKVKGLKGERAGALRGLSDTSLSTAEDAANALFGPMGGRLNFPAAKLGDVRLAEQMDFQSKQQRINENYKEADRLQEMRQGVLKRLGFLSPDEQDPLRGINEKMIEANKQAEKLYELAAGKGMAVKLVEIP